MFAARCVLASFADVPQPWRLGMISVHVHRRRRYFNAASGPDRGRGTGGVGERRLPQAARHRAAGPRSRRVAGELVAASLRPPAPAHGQAAVASARRTVRERAGALPNARRGNRKTLALSNSKAEIGSLACGPDKAIGSGRACLGANEAIKTKLRVNLCARPDRETPPVRAGRPLGLREVLRFG